MDTIRQIVEKIKLFVSSHTEELGVSAVIILVAFSSFYLGRASTQGIGTRGSGITIENTSNTASASSALNTLGKESPSVPASAQTGDIIASKNGKRYYYPWCSGVSRISPTNIVHFASAAEAEKFGLTLAANCTATK